MPHEDYQKSTESTYHSLQLLQIWDPGTACGLNVTLRKSMLPRTAFRGLPGVEDVPLPHKIVMTGLPIRHDFAVQAENMGDRTTESGKQYQKQVREKLAVDDSKKTVLVMGGGEGVGSLSIL
jgi:hypothetical protein